MTGLRWRYVWRGIWRYRARTVLIILSVAVGIFAFGLIIGAANTLRSELPLRYQEVNPASAILHTGPFDLPMVDSIRRMPEIAAAEGRTNTVIQFRKADGSWHELQLLALEDYTENRINIVRPYQGAWPPPENQVLIERNSVGILEAGIGEFIVVQNDRGDQRTLPIAGLVHDMNQAPAQITGVPYAYITRDTLVWLGLDRRFNEMHMLVADQQHDQDYIEQVAQDATDKLESSRIPVPWTEVPKPGTHFVEEFLPTILIILSALGMLALLLSGFLVINVITALLAQQTRLIGVMKAIGARPAQIADLYMRMVICFGIGALLLAIPLASLGAHTFSQFLAGQLNFDLYAWDIDPGLLGLQTAVGIVTPIAAAFFPVMATVRRTVYQALNDTGLELEDASATGINQRLAALQQKLPLSRPMRLSLRNTFRRRGRLIRTLIPLILGGAIFMSVLSVRASLFRTLEETLVQRGFDVQVRLSEPYSLRRLEHEIRQAPGVAQMEAWREYQGVPVHADDSQGDQLILYGLPAQSAVFTPDLVAGRWLLPEDQNALVVPMGLVNSEPGFALGETVTLRMGTQEEEWVIVGVNEVFQPPISPALVYANRPYVWQALGGHGQVNLARVLTTGDDALTQRRVADTLQQQLRTAGFDIRATNNASEDRTIFTERFNIITVILMIMAFLLAVVGSLGLMGTMSINVLERRREIGVLRAIGASNRAVIRLFVMEGVVISVLSWMGAIVLAQPMSRILSYAVGMNFAKMPLSYIFDLWALPLWLAIIVGVSALASLVPARNAARLSVRETLAYEG